MRKILLFPALFICIIQACKKPNITETQPVNATVNNNLAVTDTIRIPLTELGTGTYYGFTGGLYPNGNNAPSGDYGKDLKKFATSITPLDSLGNASAAGVVGFISIGSSLASNMFLKLEAISEGNPAVNPALLMANCTGGNMYLQLINDSTSEYWPVVERKLKDNHVTSKQVEVLYMETEDSSVSTAFPSRALVVKDGFEKALRLFKIKFPNLRLVYLSGRTTTFVAKGKKQQNREPVPYINGWGCKWTIEDQMNNIPALKYKGVGAVAPMVTWGWYKWSIGDVTRSDGFFWTKDYTTDGMHPNDEGAQILADNYQDFLLTDPIASIWYANH